MNMDDPRLIRSRLRRYERGLAKEKREFGHYGDGSGRRYLIGPHYLLLDDLEGAPRAFAWFEEEFPDDTGEPGHSLCWTLALHRASRASEAVERLKQTALLNLYVLPRLLGAPRPQLSGVWLGSNQEWPEYADFIPDAFFELWDENAREWARATAGTSGFTAVIDRWIQIHEDLNELPRGAKRSRLVDEAEALRTSTLVL